MGPMSQAFQFKREIKGKHSPCQTRSFLKCPYDHVLLWKPFASTESYRRIQTADLG